jgi:6-phosphogluconolactonase/glucosamine-6-phosphate isomerase/deaminase
MEIEVTNFSPAQQLALFDLLILAMYADGHLSSVEDERLQKLLVAMGFVDEIDRQREFDAAVTRIRPNVQSIYKAKELALGLADAFTVRSQQKQVYAAVENLMTSDNNVSTWENTLLMELRMKFRL